MWAEKLCEAHHLIIIIIVLLLALIFIGAGKGLGGLLGPVLKRLMGKETEVNINIGEEMKLSDNEKRAASCPLVDPQKCTAHQAEHERSMENQNNIEKLFGCISELKEEVRNGNERILLALVAGGQIKPGDIPKK